MATRLQQKIWTGLLLLVLTAAVASPVVAQSVTSDVVVRNTAELRRALVDTGVSSIGIVGPLTLSSAGFGPPLSITRPLKIFSTTGPPGQRGVLDLGNAESPLLLVGNGGALTFNHLTLIGFYPLRPLNYTTATSMMPLSAVSVEAAGAAVSIVDCVLLVPGGPDKLTSTMPFWQSAEQSGTMPLEANSQVSPAGPEIAQMQAQAPSGPPAPPRTGAAALLQQQQLVVPLALRLTYFGGDSSVSVSDSVVAFDPAGCFDAAAATPLTLAWDSKSLAEALQGGAQTVLVFVSIHVEPLHFPPLHGVTVKRNTLLTGCRGLGAPPSLDFDHIPTALVIEQRVTLTLRDGLVVLQTAPAPAGPGGAPLPLLGSIDVTRGGVLELDSVELGVNDPAVFRTELAALAATSRNGDSPPMLAQLRSGSAGASAGFLMESWTVQLGGMQLRRGSGQPAAAGVRACVRVCVCVCSLRHPLHCACCCYLQFSLCSSSAL